ncbi:MAG: acetyltransferase [Sphingobacteriales bacterium]|nr:acetyltransferase [Sphingobacteriales bacterium]
MYLYGASGHAKVILDILKDQNIPIHGLFDDNPLIHELQGIEVINNKETPLDAPLIISIGDNELRARLSKELNVEFGIAIHSSAVISESCTIGHGTVVMQGCIIQAESLIGNHVIINTGASVDHENIVADFVHISPHVTLCGNVKVGEGTHIGASAVVIPNLTIGKWCTIGAGAVVIRNVPDYSTVVGNPGKTILNAKGVLQNLNSRL